MNDRDLTRDQLDDSSGIAHARVDVSDTKSKFRGEREAAREAARHRYRPVTWRNKRAERVLARHGIQYVPRIRIAGTVEYLCAYCGAISKHRFTFTSFRIRCPECQRLVVAPGFRILIPTEEFSAERDLASPADMVFPLAEIDYLTRAPYSLHSLEVPANEDERMTR